MVFSKTSINYTSILPTMKQKTTLILLGAVVAVTMGAISFHVISATPFLVAQSVDSPNPSDHGKILGHVTYVIKDKDGNIVRYGQTDNVVTQTGHACVGSMMFVNTTITTGGTAITCHSIAANGAHGATFKYISISNSSASVAAGGTDTSLPGTVAGQTVGGTAGGATKQEVDARSVAVPTISMTGNVATVTITTPSAFTFSEITNTFPMSIQGVGLFDSAGTGGNNPNSGGQLGGDMFADQNINVSVNSGDSLSVTWTITLS
jgi:hypothetical protein